MSKFTSLESDVIEAMENAIENGHDVLSWTMDHLVSDMQTCCSTLENVSTDELRKAIEAVKIRHFQS